MLFVPLVHPVKSFEDFPVYVINSSPILTVPAAEKPVELVSVIVVTESFISPFSVVACPGTVTDVNVI